MKRCVFLPSQWPCEITCVPSPSLILFLLISKHLECLACVAPFGCPVRVAFQASLNAKQQEPQRDSREIWEVALKILKHHPPTHFYVLRAVQIQKRKGTDNSSMRNQLTHLALGEEIYLATDLTSKY